MKNEFDYTNQASSAADGEISARPDTANQNYAQPSADAPGSYYTQSYGNDGQSYPAYTNPTGYPDGQPPVPPTPPVPPVPPMQSAPPTPPSGNGSGKKHRNPFAIVAAVLVCVILLGFSGYGVYALVQDVSSDAPADTTVSEEVTPEPVMEGGSDAPSSEEASAEDNTHDNINSTVIDVTTNSAATEMTPQNVFETYVNAVVAISNEGTTTNIFGQTVTMASSGSGFIISSDGYIVTNNHVVEDAQTLTVMLTSGEEYPAEIIGTDEENDVALIKIDATDLPTVSIGDSDTMSVGEQVCAIGNPLGELTNTLTVGYVSALDREIAESSTVTINMFQTDCAINSGNSGGPLFDMHGNVIGITTAKYSGSSSGSASIEGIGFCIPINDAMDIVSDLLKYGYVRGRASLGISCQTISDTITQYYNLPIGVYVSSVNAGSAAETAGLMPGDIITAIDETTTQSVSELKRALKNYNAGDTAVLTVYRSDETSSQTISLTVVLDEQISIVSTPEVPTEQSPVEEQTIPESGYPWNGYFPFG